MLSREVLAKVRKIAILTRKQVDETFAGEYLSVFKGRGMEFSEVREYVPGDDVRTIDWNVTARMGRPFVKQFVEERELTVILAVDGSLSGEFGSEAKTKRETAAEACAALALAAVTNNDKVGLLHFTDRVERYLPPKKGAKHVMRVIREILGFEPQGRGTNIAGVLDFVNRVVKKKAVLFLVSDFIDKGYEKPLSVAAKRHDLVAIRIMDPRESELPNVGLVELEDAETGEIVLLDTSSKKIRATYKKIADEFTTRLEDELRMLSIDRIEIATNADVTNPLIRFFKERERRIRR